MPPKTIFSALRPAAMLAAALFLAACVSLETEPEKPVFWNNHPRSILVMPPVNLSPDVGAVATFLATSTIPLAESGYYVIPVTLSTETFRQNGVTVAEEAHAIHLDKLREIFGADAALYITVTRFGAKYVVLDSVVEAAAHARLVDLRSGEELWTGRVSESQGSENTVKSSDGILGMLIGAAVNQIINSISDRSYDLGKTANYRMLSGGRRSSGILFGPYHADYGRN